MSTSSAGIEPPPESVLLKDAYKKSGITAADLAASTGMSVASVHIALNGIRYKDGQGRAAFPPDPTLVKLASVLRLDPGALREAGRGRAARLLEEAVAEAPSRPATEREAQASARGRAALARQVLSAFSADELRAELDRRERVEHDRLDSEGIADAAADLRSDLGVP